MSGVRGLSVLLPLKPWVRWRPDAPTINFEWFSSPIEPEYVTLREERMVAGEGTNQPQPYVPPSWTLAAVCIESTAHERAIEHFSKRVADAAKAVCATCPVVAQCVEQVMRLEGDAPARMRFGIFGGMTPRERSALYESGGAIPHDDAANVSTALTAPISA